ncbi:MAG: FAD-binding protein [Candidatus Jordarchaeales archaeon]|nr:FAD-dependent oxidoreductase [Candidatus Jordarchaeia archaeon]
MTGKVDVLIVGAGVAGLTAAEIIGEGGFQVLVLASGYGCSQASSGTIDVLGRYKGENVLDVEAALEKFVEEKPWHIYALAGKKTVLNALSDFQFRSGGLYAGGGGRNMKIITPLGTVKSTYLVQFTMLNASFESLAESKVMLVALPGLTGYAPHIIAGKMRNKGIDVKMTKLDLFATSPFQLASSVESNPEVLIEKLREVGAGDHDWVVFPPILGLRNVKETWQVVEEKLGTRVVELPSLPPSVPGKRLYFLLRRRCEKAGVSVVLGKIVKGIKLMGGKVTRVLTNEGSYVPSALILSTGWMLDHVLRIRGMPRRGKNEYGIKVEGVENLFFARTLVSHEEKIGLGAAITAGWLVGKAALDYLRGRK